MTYVQAAVAAVADELPGLDPELVRLYALLALTSGDATTLEQVHDAWAVWQDRTRPDHRSVVPFAKLAPAVQELDRPYAEAIHRVARRLGRSRAG